MIDVVPELKLLIGEQPPVQELSPQQAQGRLQLVFRRFLGVFARREHPLALFRDDLQCLNAVTLDKAVDMKVNFYPAHLKGWALVDGLGKSIRDKLADKAATIGP